MNDMTANGRGLRAAGYFRVSTGKQAESDLSIPDQRKQASAYCESRSWVLVAEFVEPGLTATDDNRPEFQRMIERATDDDHPYDIIVVHSYSRFFRDGFALEFYIRRLAKANVRLVSITQELGDDPAQVMMRQIIGLFDEYQSREIGKHVLRAMKENARQGFYNGSRLPLGYKAEEVERRGARIKKQIVVDAVEAETVRQIFRLYLRGDGTTGPLGVKSVACWLNEHGFRTKNNGRFGLGTVHKTLTNKIYVGEHIFNRGEWKTRRTKPESEHVVMSVPAIIENSEFEDAQKTLEQRNPRVTPPRIVTGPILLTGLVFCSQCGGAMTLRTGTSRNGTVHRYYSCSTNLRIGKTGCSGRSVRMDALDEIVVSHLISKLLTLDRLTELISSITAMRAQKAAEIDQRILGIRREAIDAEIRLKRLYRSIEEGIAEIDDLLRDRIEILKRERERAQTALERVSSNVVAPMEITQEMIAAFA